MNHLWQPFKTWLLSVPGRHTCVVAGLLLVVFGLAGPLARNLAVDCAKDWLGDELKLLEQPYVLTTDKLPAADAPPVRLLAVKELDPTVAVRLVGQANEARRGASTHLKIAQFFFVRYYMFTAVAAGLALVSAICFAFISLKGWSDASPYLVTGFIVLSALTTYFSAMPALYQQTQNVDNNKRLYADYRAVVADIETYAAAGPPQKETNVLAPDQFMRKVDERLAQLRSLPLSFNTGVLKELQSSLSTTGENGGAANGASGAAGGGAGDAADGAGGGRGDSSSQRKRDADPKPATAPAKADAAAQPEADRK